MISSRVKRLRKIYRKMSNGLKLFAIILLYFKINEKLHVEAEQSNILNKSEWWDNAIIYQVYPRSFKDSNGDGIGDLNGITSRLSHIRDAGAQGLWLSPIYASPQVDFGYDISNFTNIDPIYGTFEDFKHLVDQAKSLGLRLLLDLVPNHSSDQHLWFKNSVKRVKPFDEYYIWQDGKAGPNGTRLPPNNWLSVFGGPAWTWNKERRQFYYHQFAPAQPDLNYRSPKVYLKFFII